MAYYQCIFRPIVNWQTTDIQKAGHRQGKNIQLFNFNAVRIGSGSDAGWHIWRLHSCLPRCQNCFRYLISQCWPQLREGGQFSEYVPECRFAWKLWRWRRVAFNGKSHRKWQRQQGRWCLWNSFTRQWWRGLRNAQKWNANSVLAKRPTGVTSLIKSVNSSNAAPDGWLFGVSFLVEVY